VWKESKWGEIGKISPSEASGEEGDFFSPFAPNAEPGARLTFLLFKYQLFVVFIVLTI